MEINWIDWFGYMASLVILVSLTMVSIVKLRLINFVGCILFSIFGFWINSYPTALMNLGIACINVYYLYNIYRSKEDFKLIKAEINSQYYEHFLDVNMKEIEKQLPKQELKKQHQVMYMLRNNNIAGILLGEKTKEDTFFIKVDYVIPEYRDCKLGKYFFSENTKYFKENNIKNVMTKATDNAHIKYLKKIGFTETNNGIYIKSV